MAAPLTVGIIANPVSGRDVRRLVASAATSTLADKVSIVRRLVIGAGEAGAERVLFMPEPHGIARRATETLEHGPKIEVFDFPLRWREEDSMRAVAAMRDAGCPVVIVLGGDGTNRAVAKAWRDVLLIPLSTGTNNVFPYFVEPTLAGVAAGLLATGALDAGAVAATAKRIEIAVEGEADDLALVDAVAVDERIVGSLLLFEPERLVAAVYARAEPCSIGLSSIAGLLDPCPADDDSGRFVEFARAGGRAPALRLRAPLAPGHFSELAIAAHRPLALGEWVEIAGPCLLALDGERKRVLPAGRRARLRVLRDGPRVVDVGLAMRLATEKGLFVQEEDRS